MNLLALGSQEPLQTCMRRSAERLRLLALKLFTAQRIPSAWSRTLKTPFGMFLGLVSSASPL